MKKFTYINKDNWLDERNKGIGASEIAVLCNATEFMTPLDLWEIKTGKRKQEISEQTQQLFDAGHDQEPITLYRFLKNHDNNLCDKFLDNYYKNKTFKFHDVIHILTKFNHNDFMFCHPDMIFHDFNVEAKYIKYKGNEWNFDDLTEEGVPYKYYLQVQFQMMCTGLTKTILCANYLGAEHYEFEIDVNTDLFPTFEKLCFDFWQLVKKNEPPMPQKRSDVKKLFPNKNYCAMTLPDEMELETLMMKDRYDILKRKKKNVEKEMESIKSTVMSLMTNNNVLQTNSGEQIAKITESESERIMALSKIKKEYPKVYKYLHKNNVINKTLSERFNF